MPMKIWVDADRQLRHAVANERLTDRDLLEAWGDALADPAYDPAADNLVDMSGVEQFEVTSHGAQRLADVMAMCAKPLAPGVRPRVAFVAPPDDRAFRVLRRRLAAGSRCRGSTALGRPLCPSGSGAAVVARPRRFYCHVVFSSSPDASRMRAAAM
jgi:hypothetical protein